jgi:hypothetical protein
VVCSRPKARQTAPLLVTPYRGALSDRPGKTTTGSLARRNAPILLACLPEFVVCPPNEAPAFRYFWPVRFQSICRLTVPFCALLHVERVAKYARGNDICLATTRNSGVLGCQA